ncbi:peptidoglycan editing factor PgeF [Sphingomonas gilva]|uniref:Purine nucleoside phosphorylase n=1 Tax=Sphingomonas gilva TaxID=2305907 RepID=A0A396RVD3_9SPHN|nr:peptidoglycan editing factor PgeF [Sphingomonas gilva]RHW17631.1 peptidoglycan editing factor PgeF [Sphingomonas gilva]
MVEPVRARSLAAPHGFGTSAFGDCGLGSGDPAAGANRGAVAEAVLPGAALTSVYQVHSAEAVVAEPWPVDARPHADALVTDRPGLLIGIVTADCAPVLFADAEAGVVGAAHAGWKGALGGVTDATIALMETLGARRERIAAAIGPCIARASYEVEDGFARAFAPDDERFFTAGRPGHLQFDLEAYVAHRLAAAGIARVEALGLDTYADEARFFSYRRATHRGEATYGRQISVIGLP